MKKNIITTLGACIALCCAQHAAAQDYISASMEQKMLLHTYELFESYERYAAIDEDFTNYADELRALFTSGDAPVYNDLLGITDGGLMTVKDYVKAMAENSSTTRITIKNIDRKSIRYEDGKWKVDCTFDKTLNLTNGCGVEFASEFLCESDYHLTATVVYDPEADLCLFESIKGQGKAGALLPTDYKVIKHTSPREKDITVGGAPLRFNAMQQAFIPADAAINYNDPETSVKLIPEREDCNIWKLKFIPHHWKMKVHYDMLLGNYYRIESTDSNVSPGSSGQEMGIDFGYLFVSRKALRMSFNFGLGFAASKYSLDYAADRYSYHCSSYDDANGIGYTRNYYNVESHEQYSDNRLIVPLSVELEGAFSKWASIYLQVGLKNYLALSSSMQATTSIGSITGYYKNPYDITISEGYPYNGFGSNGGQGFAYSLDNTSSLRTPARTFSADLSFGGGLRLRPYYRLPLYLDLGVAYQMDLLSAFSDRGLDDTLETALHNPAYYPATYHLDNKLTGHEEIHSLTNSIKSIRRQNLKMSIGLIYKF